MTEAFVRVPGIVIGAPQGRSGKTTVSLGICAALAARGLLVQPFKKGPDYIDPSWLSAAAGKPCRSLDPFFFNDGKALRQAYASGAHGADFSLVEGNHGLYDSFSDEEGLADTSTAAVARCLKTPVLLVVNAARISRSAAALVHGYQTFEPDTPIAGVILNNVAQSRHESKLRQAIEGSCGIPVVGALPRDASLTIPDRHLGLVPQAEDNRLNPAIAACRQAAEAYIDLDRVLEIARTAEPIFLKTSLQLSGESRNAIPSLVNIGVMRDRAFSFYYPENLEALENAGAELVFLDALQDRELPEIDALYIGGGFPEMFLNELEANRSFRETLRTRIEQGLPVYAECGGLMYLSQAILWEGRRVEMVRALPYEVEMQPRPQGHGYVAAETNGQNPFLPIGTRLRGHEFHHSQIRYSGERLETAYRLERGTGLGEKQDGLVCHNILAAYTHLHAGGCPAWAPGIVRAAYGWRSSKNSKEANSGG